MIGKISGRLDWRGPDHVLIDVRGVGYIVHVSERTVAGHAGIGEAVSLYTDLLVREDLLQLFGFPTMLEKEWHKLLMTVQGVGAKAIDGDPGELGPRAWDGRSPWAMRGQCSRRRASGRSIAQRVILELKAKAPGVMAHGVGLSSAAAADDVVVEPVETPPRARAARVDDGGSAAGGGLGRFAVGAGEPRLWAGRRGAGGGDSGWRVARG